MKLHNANAEIFVPDAVSADGALRRTTHMAVGAHQDDVEILAFHGILQCRHAATPGFTAVICTDGAGSARAGAYANFTNEQMQGVRWQEQREAATVGHYSAAVQLKYSSAALKEPHNADVAADFRALFELARPEVIYTHNLADKHDTHIGVAVKLLTFLRSLPADQRPKKVYGCEVWRNLDWMPDADKVVLDVSRADHIAAGLLGVYDSQIAGGKRYDLASMGRWRANATYLESHAVDTSESCIFAVDLTPLVADPSLDMVDYITRFIDKFKEDVCTRLAKPLGIK